MFAHARGNLNESEWVIVGIPSDLGSLSSIKDYLRAPESIREASYRVFSPIFGDIDMDKIYDYGNLDLEDVKSLEDLYNKIYEDIRKIYNKNKKYIFLGGDHSITYPIIKVLKEEWEDFILVYFDSHPDLHPDPYINYQSFIYYLIREEVIKPENIIMLGISNLSFDEKNILKDFGITYFTPYDIWGSVKEIAREVGKITDGRRVYISIDLDVFDSGCGHWIEPFGIRPYHYFEIIKNITGYPIGLDIVELFSSEFCENLAAKIIVESIAIFNLYKSFSK
ncbi:arginase family protein [Nanoarchaeota archaeon NZ13-N]|nr:MAG: arginase family protein [Nanoarchaeota archaeon NZ13-N]